MIDPSLIPGDYLVPGAWVLIASDKWRPNASESRFNLAKIERILAGVVVVGGYSFRRTPKGTWMARGYGRYMFAPLAAHFEANQRRRQRESLKALDWGADRFYGAKTPTDQQIEAVHAAAVACGLLVEIPRLDAGLSPVKE